MGTDERLGCPVCGARFRESPTCSRCGADLEPLMTLAARAYSLRQGARDALRICNFVKARNLAARAQSLYSAPEGKRLLLITSWLTSES